MDSEFRFASWIATRPPYWNAIRTPQNDLSHLTGRRVGYVMHKRRVRWNGIIRRMRNCLVRNYRVVEHAKNNHCQCHRSTAKADGTKMKPFVVFKSAKQKGAALNENFKHCCIVSSSSNAWMNEEPILIYLKRVTGSSSSQERLLALDTFAAHLTKPFKSHWRKWQLMMLLFQVDALNTSKHMMYFRISFSKTGLYNFLMND